MTTRSIWTGLRVDLRRSVRPALTITGVAIAAFLLIGGAAVSVVFFVVERAKPENPLSASIPLSQYTSSMLQAFECVRVGAGECDQYGTAISYLSTASPAEGLIYTPFTDDDPGEQSAGETRTLRLSEKLSSQDWKAVATAITLDGQATDVTVPPNAVQSAGVDVTTYSVPGTDVGANLAGQMAFGIADDGIQLKSVIYG